MNEDFEQLKTAHHSDVAIRGATQAIHDLRSALLSAQKGYASSLANIERLEKSGKEVWREEKRAEESTRSYTTQRENAVRALEQGLGSAEAAERQIKQCEVILDDLETTTLELMERQEVLAAQLAEARDTSATANTVVATLTEDTPPQIIERKRSVVEHTATRDAALATLDAALRDRYNALTKRKVTALAPIRREACSACRRVVPAQQVVDLKLHRLQACRGCGRWLILDDDTN